MPGVAGLGPDPSATGVSGSDSRRSLAWRRRLRAAVHGCAGSACARAFRKTASYTYWHYPARTSRPRAPRRTAARCPWIRSLQTLMNTPDPAPVIDLIEAFRRSKTMFAAVALGVFDFLERSPADAAAAA